MPVDGGTISRSFAPESRSSPLKRSFSDPVHLSRIFGESSFASCWSVTDVSIFYRELDAKSSGELQGCLVVV
jgi:hypothetical protein